MNYYKGVRCIRCGHIVTEDSAFEGCPDCLTENERVNLETYYDFGSTEERAVLSDRYKRYTGRGLWRYREFLPIKPDIKPVSIGEGDTPLIHAKRLGESFGLSNLYLKCETQNPTWSYKDRLCSVGLTKAREKKAKVVCVASTGNHGAATAAYAAAANIPCVVFTIPSIPETMKTLMLSYGAYVFATPTAKDRFTIMKYCVDHYGWFPLSGFNFPVAGSNPFGIDGYKTISFEIFDALGEMPDFIAFPSAYSDGLYGAWKGVRDLYEIGVSNKKCRMIVAEVFGSLKETFRQNAAYPVTVHAEDSICFSIACPQGTFQGYSAIKKSGGYAETSSDEESFAMQIALSKNEGIYAEAASVTSLVAIKKLAREGKISRDDKIVAVLTSSGLKDPLMTASRLAAVPVIEPKIEALKRALNSVYHYQL